MSTYKRRIVYLSDDEWAHLRAYAKLRCRTVSAVIRDMWNVAAETQPLDKPSTTVFNRTAQAERDAILRRINKAK